MIDDRRLRRVAHWQDTFVMPDYGSRQAWEERASAIRQRILLAAGLLPFPERTPLNPRVTGRTELAGVSVENVAFESFPNFFCTGNLYRPAGSGPAGGGPFPAILTPHGHWQEGRFVQREAGSVPARCISLARQGYVVFAPDMAGYNDSRQVVHRGFDSPARALWGIGTLGLQLWNNIRALDYLLSLPGVDGERIGCTGESGGATQSYLLTAVDSRIRVAAPVNMLSAHYAGGCECENAPGLRLDLTNMEIVAAAAPRPQLLVAATGDWTVNTPRVEYPAVRTIYELYGAAPALECVQIDAGHNYNLASREAVYGFLARHLGGSGRPAPRPESAVFWTGPSEPIREEPGAHVDDVSPLRVFPDDRPLPSGALAGGAEVAAARRASMAQRAAADYPAGVAALEAFRAAYGDAYRLALGLEVPDPDDVVFGHRESRAGADFVFERLWIGTKRRGERVPAILVTPAGESAGAGTDTVPVLVVHGEGKDGWFGRTAGTSPGAGSGDGPERWWPAPGDRIAGVTDALVAESVGAGRAVLLIDAFLTGEYQTPAGRTGRPVSETHFAAYNRVDVAWQAQDVVTAAAALRKLTGAAGVDVVGWGDASLWCLLARGAAPEAIRRLAVDVDGLDWDDERLYLDRLYLPHLPRLGGLATAVALAAPAPLFLHHTAGKLPERITRLYAALDAAESLRWEDGD